MPVLLPNATLSTSRPTYTMTTGTSAPQPYGQSIPAHVGPVGGGGWKILPTVALESDYQAQVETGTDMRTGDRVTSIIQADGITPWPGTFVNELYEVTYVQESAPGILAHRTIFIARIVGGGPTTS